jgi:alpha-galactosidase
VAVGLVALGQAWGAQGKGPVKVFILAGQSNMEGQAVADLDGKDYNEGKGTLTALMRDPAKAPQFKHLKDAQGKWAVRGDVWVRYKRETGPLLHGPLTLGFAVYGGPHHFGPELQFGHVMGDYLDDQVLLIKTAWGGKSLQKDFRPPSSGGTVGPFYTEMIGHVKQVLADLRKEFPDYDGKGYELAGFGWHQGWNDGCTVAATDEYEKNMANFIRDVRKDLGAKDLPFVIANSGFAGREQKNPRRLGIMAAQAGAAALPEFKGSVVCVETRDFFRPQEESPSRQVYHWNGNAETYFLIGDVMGEAMKKLCPATAKK